MFGISTDDTQEIDRSQIQHTISETQHAFRNPQRPPSQANIKKRNCRVPAIPLSQQALAKPVPGTRRYGADTPCTFGVYGV